MTLSPSANVAPEPRRGCRHGQLKAAGEVVGVTPLDSVVCGYDGPVGGRELK